MDWVVDVTTPSELLKREAAYVRSWLNSVRNGQRKVPDGFNLLGLAETAGLKARSELNVEWAEVAVFVYDWLDETSSGFKSFDFSSMNLRAYLIIKCGAMKGHTILDPDVINNWFLRSEKLSMAEAQSVIARWNDIVAKGLKPDSNLLEMVKTLRKTKNRLSVMKLLVEEGSIVPDKHLSEWLNLQSYLP